MPDALHSDIRDDISVDSHQLIGLDPLNNTTDVFRMEGNDSSIDIYKTTIRHVEQATRLQIELDIAQADLDRWKKTQLSSQYARATPAARTILNEQRTVYTQAVVNLKQSLERVLTSLSNLPDLAAHSKLLSDQVDGTKLISYAQKMDEWVHSARVAHECIPKSNDESRLENDDWKMWTWDQIRISVQMLDAFSQKLTESLYLRYFTNVSSDTKGNSFEGEKLLRSGWHVKVDGLQQEVESMKHVRETLKEKLAKGKTELDALKAKLKEIEEIQDQNRNYLRQCEKRQREDHELIEKLAKRLERAKTLPRALANLPDGLLKAIRKFVSDELERDIISRLGELFYNTYGHNTNIILQQLQRPLQDRAMAINHLELSQTRT